MRLNKRNNTKKFNKIILFAIMFIGLGFAAISATLGITSIAKIGHITFDVHFENVEVKEGSMEATSPASINASDNTQINFSLHLTTPGEFYEFETDIVNNGTLDAYLSSIELLGLDENTKKYLKVTYRYSNGGKIRINDLLKSGETERIKVKVDFLYDITLDDLPTEETSLDFILNMIYTQDNGTGVERDKAEVVVDILGQEMIAYIDNLKSKYISSETGVNFARASSDTNGKGLYLRAGTENDKYPIYYFRGGDDQDGDEIEDYLNNHVLFGGFCWKIVRTTELGGTKIIYDGLPDANNQCNTGVGIQIGISAFNKDARTLADVGYMYGTRYEYTSWDDIAYVYGSDVSYIDGEYTLNGITENADTIGNIKTKHYTCKSTTDIKCDKVYYIYSFYEDKVYAIPLIDGKKLENILDESFANENNSEIKNVIDNWFKNNLLSQEDKLEDAVWCNDRSISSGGYLKDSDLTTLKEGNTYLGGYEARGLHHSATSNPGLKNADACSNKNDRFTKNDTTNGNGALTYPVGLLTADEAIVAGRGDSNYKNISYLSWDSRYFTLSPFSVAYTGDVSRVIFNQRYFGQYIITGVSGNAGVRPSIVLKKGIVATSGDGSSEHPYVVE